MRMADWILQHGDDLQVALFFSLLFVLIGLERLAPRRPGPMERARRWPVNFLMTALNLVAMSLLPVSFISAALWAGARGIGILNYIRPPAIVLIVVTLLVRAFISFNTHYLNHIIPILWRVHRVHHLDTELDVSTTVRLHPLEFVINLLLGVPVVLAFGLTPWVLVGYEVLDVVVTLSSHSNVRLAFALDRVLRYLIVTPGGQSMSVPSPRLAPNSLTFRLGSEQFRTEPKQSWQE